MRCYWLREQSGTVQAASRWSCLRSPPSRSLQTICPDENGNMTYRLARGC